MRGKIAWMLRVVREARFAALVAGAIVAGFSSGPAWASPPIQLSDITPGPGGFVINGEEPRDSSGRSVSGAGDVNGDGLADLIVGAYRADPYGRYSGRSYVVFGKASGTGIQLSEVVGGTGGFVINGERRDDRSGRRVSGAGDVNGDGLADLIVGANRADPNGQDSGRSYIVFGKASGALVQLWDVTAGAGGFAISGEAVSDNSGWDVSGAGDINGDGLADLIVGAIGSEANGLDSGRSYVIFGKADGTLVQLTDVTAGRGGFAIDGETVRDSSGGSVSSAGDVNGDGLADLIVGAAGADPNGDWSGRSYVVFGKTSATLVQLTDVAAGLGGFVIDGEVEDDRSGSSVSGAGDVNGDGLADLIVGAWGADPNGSTSGRSYVVFGKSSGTLVQLTDVTAGLGGFAIDGEASGDISGSSVSAGGDINGDGLADLIVGAPGADPNGPYSGRSYLVFGKATGTLVQLSDVAAGTGGFAMDGEVAYDRWGQSVSTAGDVNGDGLADLIGGTAVNFVDATSSRSYVIFSPEMAAASGTFKMTTVAGDGEGGEIVPRTHLPRGLGDVARVAIDFSDDDAATGGGLNGASTETVVLTRSKGGITNLMPIGDIADVVWEITTDRIGFTDARVTLKYLDSEVAGISGTPSSLAIFSAPAKSGPWTELTTTLDATRNEVSATVAGFGFFAIANGSPLIATPTPTPTPTPRPTPMPIQLTDLVSGNGGYVILAEGIYDGLNRSVSGAGDVNGDGIPDLLVGGKYAYFNGENSGRSYVIFGGATGFIWLSDISAGTGGFAIEGEKLYDTSGSSVSAGGDINGDGLADLIVGAPGADPNGDRSGRSYVVFGKATGTLVRLSDITAGIGGFVMNGEVNIDRSGGIVSDAGDVNGDGLDDMIIGAYRATRNSRKSGRSYVVFGKASGTPIELSDIVAGIGGFGIDGEAEEDASGFSVSGAGDVNGDGLADLIVGAFLADPNGSQSGRSYVVFGKADGTLVQLSDVSAGAGGFTISGEASGDTSGSRISGAGDFNGDGLADLIVGAPRAEPNGPYSGRSYLVFGKATGTLVQLSDVSAGIGGFTIDGEMFNSRSGTVSNAGDVNGDGLADLIVGAIGSSPGPGRPFSGRAYVVFGNVSGENIQLSDIAAGMGGFAIDGATEYDLFGGSVSSAGDVNGDGLADLFIGAPGFGYGYSTGRSYVVFSPETPPLVAPADIPRSAVYNAFSRAGDGPGGNPVVPTVVGESRVTIDWPDDDFGSGEFNFQTSKERVVLYRSNSPVRNLEPMSNIAQVCWGVLTDRPGAGPAEITFKYLNHEIADIALGSEADLAIFAAEDFIGPWIRLPTIIDAARNTARVTVPLGTFKHFALAEAGTAPVAPVNAARNFELYE